MKSLFLILLFFITLSVQCQTFIEMMSPEDAKLVLLQVYSPEEADVRVYKTRVKSEYKQWDLMWKFQKWGFSNFNVFVARDSTELTVYAGESLLYDFDRTYIPHAKIYFVENKDDRGYKNKDFQIEGIMRVDKGFMKLNLKKRDFK